MKPEKFKIIKPFKVNGRPTENDLTNIENRAKFT